MVADIAKDVIRLLLKVSFCSHAKSFFQNVQPSFFLVTYEGLWT